MGLIYTKTTKQIPSELFCRLKSHQSGQLPDVNAMASANYVDAHPALEGAGDYSPKKD